MVVSGVAPPPGEVLKGLRRWLDEQFGWKVINLGNVLKRPHQTDTHSCSICAISTISHGVFGDPLWRQPNASTHRIHWLLKLGEHELSPPIESIRGTNYAWCTHTQPTQVTEPTPEISTQSDPEQFNDSGTTDMGKEPDIDTPALSVSVDGNDRAKYLYCKRKLSISPSDKAKTTHKFPRTAYRQVQLKDEGQAYQNNDGKHDSSRTHTNPDNVITANTYTSLSTVEDHPKINRKVQPGTSQSARASRKLRDKVTSGTYIVQEKRLKSWREKISNLDPGSRLDKANPRKVFHSRCHWGQGGI